MWYFEAVSRFRFQTCSLNIRTVNKQMQIWRHICFAMASLIALQCAFKIVNVSQQNCPCICFDKVAIIAIYIHFATVTFWSYDFQWLPNFSTFKSREIRESLEIIRSKCNSSKVNINRDDGNFVKTNTWTILLRNINNLESALKRNQRSHCKADMTSNLHLLINSSYI